MILSKFPLQDGLDQGLDYIQVKGRAFEYCGAVWAKYLVSHSHKETYHGGLKPEVLKFKEHSIVNKTFVTIVLKISRIECCNTKFMMGFNP